MSPWSVGFFGAENLHEGDKIWGFTFYSEYVFIFYNQFLEDYFFVLNMYAKPESLSQTIKPLVCLMPELVPPPLLITILLQPQRPLILPAIGIPSTTTLILKPSLF